MVRDPEAGYSLSVQVALPSVAYLVGQRSVESISTMNLQKMEGKSMRILNRVIVASALVVPMGLGVSGIAVADVAAGSPVLPTQSGSDDCDRGSDNCDDRSDNCDDGDGLLGGLLGGGGDSDDGECGGDDDGEDRNSGSLG